MIGYRIRDGRARTDDTTGNRLWKRWLRGAAVFVLFLCGTDVATAQFRPVVQIDSLENASGQRQLDALGTAIVDGIAFTLRLIGDYEVRTEAVSSGFSYDEETLAARALEEELNNVIFGEIARTDDGSYRVTIAAYDQGVDAVVFEDSVTFDSLFDAFDIVDGITLSLVEGFSGVRLTFGTVRFAIPTGEAPVAIRLGEVDLTPGTTLVERVPAGEHIVTVSQERPLGRYEYQEPVSVVAEETVEFTVSMPVLTREESEVLADGVAVWQDGVLAGRGGTDPGGDGGVESVDSLEAARGLIDSTFFRTYRATMAERYRRRLVEGGDTVAAAADTFGTGRSGVLPNWLDTDFSVAGRFARSAPIRETITAQAALPGYGGSSRRVLPFRRINVDGSDSDWDGITGFNDTTGDMRPGVVDTYEATDLVEVRIAYDTDYIYLMYRTADRTYERRNTGYKFHFDMESGARVYLDIWPADRGDPAWAGYNPPDRDDGVGWSNLDAGMRVSFTNGFPQSVLEVAVPLKTIADWRYFKREMGNIWVSAEYIKSGDHTWVDSIESISAIPFPTRALMLVEGE